MTDDQVSLIRETEKEAKKKIPPPDQPTKRGLPCPDFGVKSYLHNFYDSDKSYKDPTLYEEEAYDEDDDLSYLLRPRRKKKCHAVWWKIFVWIGANLLIFGILGILISFLIPPHQEVIGVNNSVEKVDRGAVYFNYSLDVCKLISLIVFCVGGITLTVALIFPSFLSHYCEDSRCRDDDWRAPPMMSSRPGERSRSIPYSSRISNVQPPESRIGGRIKFEDE